MEIKDLYLNTESVRMELMSQRCATFNFFLVLSGLFVNAIILCLRQDVILIAIVLSALLSFFSVLFLLLERKNIMYYKNICEILRAYERHFQKTKEEFKGLPLLRLREEEMQKTEFKKTIGYADFFTFTYLSLATLGTIFDVILILNLCGISIA